MPTCPAPQTFGFFAVELRVQWPLTKGNSLSRLEAVVDWERFRPLLDPYPPPKQRMIPTPKVNRHISPTPLTRPTAG